MAGGKKDSTRYTETDAPIDRAFLNIPDEENHAIGDARMTYWVTIVSGILFIAAIFLFILL